MFRLLAKAKIYQFNFIYFFDLFINISDSENLLNGNTPTPIASQKAFNIIADSLRRIDVSLTHQKTNSFQSLFAIFFHCHRLCLRSMLLHRQSISNHKFKLQSVYFLSFTHFFLTFHVNFICIFITTILFKVSFPCSVLSAFVFVFFMIC